MADPIFEFDKNKTVLMLTEILKGHYALNCFSDKIGLKIGQKKQTTPFMRVFCTSEQTSSFSDDRTFEDLVMIAIVH